MSKRKRTDKAVTLYGQVATGEEANGLVYVPKRKRRDGLGQHGNRIQFGGNKSAKQ